MSICANRPLRFFGIEPDLARQLLDKCAFRSLEYNLHFQIEDMLRTFRCVLESARLRTAVLLYSSRISKQVLCSIRFKLALPEIGD